MKYWAIRILFIALILGFTYGVTLADPIPSQNAEPVAVQKPIDSGISEWETGSRISDGSSHGVETLNGETPAIPEPATALLVGISLLFAGTMGRRRKASA